MDVQTMVRGLLLFVSLGGLIKADQAAAQPIRPSDRVVRFSDHSKYDWRYEEYLALWRTMLREITPDTHRDLLVEFNRLRLLTDLRPGCPTDNFLLRSEDDALTYLEYPDSAAGPVPAGTFPTCSNGDDRFDLRCFKMTANTGEGFKDKSRKVIWIQCGMHGGHESSSQMAALAFIRNLIANHDDPWVRSLLSQHVLVLLPSVNVNGNFRDAECTSDYANHNNVNLLFNFGYDFVPSSEPLGKQWENCKPWPEWALGGRSHDGKPRPFSEPEARIIRNMIMSLCHPDFGEGHELAVHLDMHNNGNDFLWVDPNAAMDGGSAMYGGVIPDFAAGFSSQFSRYATSFNQEINAAWNPFNLVSDPSSPSEVPYRHLAGEGILMSSTEIVDQEHPLSIRLQEGNARSFGTSSMLGETPLKIGAEEFEFTILDRDSAIVVLTSRGFRGTPTQDHAAGELITLAAFPLNTQRSSKGPNAATISADWFAEIFHVNSVYMEPPAVWRLGIKPGMPASNTEMMYVNFNYGVTYFIQSIVGDSLKPVLAWPEEKGKVGFENLALLWRSAGERLLYDLQVSETPDFSTLTLDRHDITDTSSLAPGLSILKNYFWRVRCTGSGSTSPWSSIRSFELSPELRFEGVFPQVAVEDSLFDVTTHANVNPQMPVQIRYRIESNATWLRIDSLTGRVTGTPGIHDIGTIPVTVSAHDSVSISARQQFQLNVVHRNHIPQLMVVGLHDAYEDSLYRIKVFGADPDTLLGDILKVTPAVLPHWLMHDSISHEITGRPGANDIGPVVLSLKVEDDKGAFLLDSITFTVRHTNHSPAVLGRPPSHAAEDTMYVGRWSVADPDTARFHDRLHFQYSVVPSWLRVDTSNGIFSGIPGAFNVGDTILVLRAMDDSGAVVEGRYPIAVTHTEHAPQFVTSGIEFLRAVEDSAFTFQIVALDVDAPLFGGRLSYDLAGHPHWLTVDTASGIVTGTPVEGDLDTSFTIRVTRGELSNSLSLHVKVVPVNDPPLVRGIPIISFSEDSSAAFLLSQYVTDPDNHLKQLKWTVSTPGDVAPGSIAAGGFRGSRQKEIARSADGLELLMMAFSSSGVPESLKVAINPFTSLARVSATRNFFADKIPVVFTATDPGGLQSSDTTFVNIQGVNDPPELKPLPPLTSAEFDSVFVPFRSLYSKVADPDDPDSSHSWAIGASVHVRTRATQDGIWCVPEDGWHGTESLLIIVRDPGGLGDSTHWSLQVAAVPHPPSFVTVPDTLAFSEIPYLWRPRVYDRHPADTLFQFSLEGPAWLSIDSTGAIRGRPPQPARVKVRLLVFDCEGRSDTMSYFLTVKSNDETRDLAGAIPTSFVLKQNYPNPFNPSTTIRFGFPQKSAYTLRVFNLLGQRVDEIEVGEKEPGYYEIVWTPHSLASGVYISVLEGRTLTSTESPFRLVQKMLLLK